MKLTIEFTGQEFIDNNDAILAMINGEDKPKKKAAKPKRDELEETELEEDEDDELAEDDETTEVDADMIKEAIQSALKAGKKEAVVKLFTKYKAKTVSGLKETLYEKFYNELKALTKKK